MQLACARIGAVHTVVFGGFSAEALAGRVVDCRARVLLTASGAMRGRKLVPLKRIADAACDIAERAGVLGARPPPRMHAPLERIAERAGVLVRPPPRMHAPHACGRRRPPRVQVEHVLVLDVVHASGRVPRGHRDAGGAGRVVR